MYLLNGSANQSVHQSVRPSVTFILQICKIYVCDVIMYLFSHQLPCRFCWKWKSLIGDMKLPWCPTVAIHFLYEQFLAHLFALLTLLDRWNVHKISIINCVVCVQYYEQSSSFWVISEDFCWRNNISSTCQEWIKWQSACNCKAQSPTHGQLEDFAIWVPMMTKTKKLLLYLLSGQLLLLHVKNWTPVLFGYREDP